MEPGSAGHVWKVWKNWSNWVDHDEIEQLLPKNATNYCLFSVNTLVFLGDGADYSKRAGDGAWKAFAV
jgi:hypothetical protein